MSEPAQRFGPFALTASPERARLRLALIDAALELGIPAISAEELCRRADIELTSFQRDFASVAACAVAVYNANIAEFDRVVFGAVAATRGWPARLRVAAYGAARYLHQRPRETRFNLVSMLQAGETAQAYRDRYVRRIVELIDEGREVAADPDALAPGLAEGIFGSIYELLVRQAGAGLEIGANEEMIPGLMYVAVRPYLGDEAAREELRIPPPARSEPAR
jgi:AcrR family transcriptional regulator